MPNTVREGSAGTMDAPSRDGIRAALEHVLTSPHFAASDQRRKFLRFVVEEALAGRAQGLKGVVIAQEVYLRGADFSGRADPVVRLDARRLRRDLDSYYVGPGASDPVRISIPKGGYAPLFETLEIGLPAPRLSASEPPRATAGSAGTAARPQDLGARPWWRRGTAAGLVLLVLLAAAWFMRPAPTATPAPPVAGMALRGYPRVAIMPFIATGASEEAHMLSAGLAVEVAHELRRFEGLRIFRLPGGTEAETVLSQLRGNPGALFGVYGQVFGEGAQLRIDASLHDLRTDEVIWSEAYDLSVVPGGLMELRGRVAARIATALGQPYGPINEGLVRRGVGTVPFSVESYLCVVQAYAHRRNFAFATHGPALACLEAAVKRDPEYSDAWAMLAWLHLDAGRYEFPGAAPIETEYARALDAATHARALAPNSVLALKALSSIQHYRGDYEESERLGRRAVELNPNDPDALAQLAWRLVVRGQFEEGVALLQDAIARSVSPPAWYFHTLAIDHMMRGEYAAMREQASRAALSGRPIAEALLAIAAAGLGDRETTRAALSRITPGWDAEAYFRRHGATDAIAAVMMEGLETARDLVGDTASP